MAVLATSLIMHTRDNICWQNRMYWQHGMCFAKASFTSPSFVLMGVAYSCQVTAWHATTIVWRFHIPGFSAACGHEHKWHQSWADWCQIVRCENVPLASELLWQKTVTFILVSAGSNVRKLDAKTFSEVILGCILLAAWGVKFPRCKFISQHWAHYMEPTFWEYCSCGPT